MIDDLEPFPEFTQEEWSVIKQVLHNVVLVTDTILFEEGTEEKELYFIKSGSLRVTKKGLHVTRLESGDWVGEIAALTAGNKRTATVTAETHCTLWKLCLDDLSKVTENNDVIYFKVISALAKGIAGRVKDSTEIAIEQKLEIAQAKIIMAEFLCAVLFGIASFLYALKLISLMNLKPKVTEMVSIPLILLLSTFLLIFIKRSSLPLASFGLTWKNWKESVSESLLWTLVMIIATLPIKWALISTIPSFKAVPLMHFHQLLQAHFKMGDWLLITIGYSLFVPLQALMVNGCMQTAFTKFFLGPNRTLRAILLSNLIFSTLHLQISLSFAISVFFIGCVWGWLYSRHQTIVGISLSHIILGIWGGIFLGLL